MTQPLVAIIGRPNVGKSTLFNRLTGSRKAIVGDEPGITRDRMFGEVEWKAKTFRLRSDKIPLTSFPLQNPAPGSFPLSYPLTNVNLRPRQVVYI